MAKKTLLALTIGSAGMSIIAQPSFARAESQSVGDTKKDDQEIVVTALRQTSTVAKQGVEIRDLPQSISLIDNATLRESNVRRIEDINFQSVGIAPSAPLFGNVSGPGYARGFDSNILIDGYQTTNASIILPSAIVDRVEILRGPTSVLYGQGAPGASINFVLKRPHAQFGGSVNATIDDQGTRAADFDVTGSAASWLQYRIVTTGERSTTYRDYEVNRRIAFYPMLRILPTDTLKIDLLAGYDRYIFRAARDFYAGPGSFTVDELENQLRPSDNLSGPNLPLTRIDTTRFEADIDQSIGSDWVLGATYSYVDSKVVYFAQVQTYRIDTTSPLFYRDYSFSGRDQNVYSRNITANVHLKGTFDTFGVKNSLLLVAERITNHGTSDDRLLDTDLPLFDPFNPVFEDFPNLPGQVVDRYIGSGATRSNSLYVNDLMTLSPHIKVQLGLRHDSLLTVATGVYGDGRIRKSRLSPSAGVVWQPSNSTSLYGSYSTSFVPQFGITKTGVPLLPEESAAYEVGLKQEFLNRKIALTVAAFQITKRNILETDPTDFNYTISGGVARSRGFEFEIQGRPTRYLSIHAGVSRANPKITRSTDFPVGSTLGGSYPWTVLASARYALDGVGLAKSWVSGNYFFGSRRQNRLPSDGQFVPATKRLDVAAGTQLGPLDLQVNVKNVFSRRNFLSNGTGLLQFDTPRSIGGTIGVKF